MDLFGAAHGWRVSKKAPLPKTCHTYPTMMKLGTLVPCLKKIQKIYKPRDAPLGSADSIFSPEMRRFSYIKKYRYRLYFDMLFLILLTFFESLKIFYNKHGYNFDDVNKSGYSGPS